MTQDFAAVAKRRSLRYPWMIRRKEVKGRLFRLYSKVRCFVSTPAGLEIFSTTRAGRYRVEHLSGWVAVCGQVVCTLIGAQRSAGT